MEKTINSRVVDYKISIVEKITCIYIQIKMCIYIQIIYIQIMN